MKEAYVIKPAFEGDRAAITGTVMMPSGVNLL